MKKAFYMILLCSLYLTFGFNSAQAANTCIDDQTAPKIEAPNTIRLEQGQENPVWEEYVQVTDECGAITISFMDSLVKLDTEGVYNLFIFAGDQFGNHHTKKIVVEVVPDYTTPTIVGMKDVTVEVHSELTSELLLEGVTASDEQDGDLTESITVNTDAVNIHVVGEYEVLYEVIDSSQNKKVEKQKVIVLDRTKPTIEAHDLTIEVLTSEPDYFSSVSASDNYDKKLKLEIDDQAVDLTKLGVYELKYTVTDDSGNQVSQTIQVTVVDSTKPSIKVHHQTLDIYSATPDFTTFFEVIDLFDQNPTIEADFSHIDVNTFGEYKVMITATDQSGNTNSKELVIQVVDQIAPVFEPIDHIVYQLGDEIPNYLEHVVVTDNVDGDIPTSQVIVYDQYVNLKQEGLYSLTYQVMDSSLNSTSYSIVVRVVDDMAPDLNVIEEITLPVGFMMDLAQFGTAYDNRAGNISSKIMVDDQFVNYEKAGSYPIRFIVTDLSGNMTIKESILVLFADTTAPKIEGVQDHKIKKGTEIDLLEGLIAYDDIDGDLTDQIEIQGDYDLNKKGTYSLQAYVKDNSGNETVIPFTLKVTVEENNIFLPALIGSIMLIVMTSSGLAYLKYHKKDSFSILNDEKEDEEIHLNDTKEKQNQE